MKSLKTYIREEEEKGHTKEINDLISSVGGGNKSAGVFESWVHIVTTLKGGKTLPTIEQVNAAKNDGEFHAEGKAWLNKIGFPGGNKKFNFDPEKVLLAIEFIGGDIKDSAMPTITWETVEILHKNVTKQYYKKMPKIWKTEKTKENTADIVIITKGTAADLSAALPDCTEEGSIAWDINGLCKIPKAPGIEWYQVSLKKGIDDARIGKLGIYLKGRYASVGYETDVTQLTQIDAEITRRGNYLGVSYGFDDRIDQILLDEGLFDVFKWIKDKVVGGFKKFVDWAKKKLRKLVGGAVKLASKVMKSNPVLDNANEILKLSGVSAKTLSEEFLAEKESKVVAWKKDSERQLLLKKMIAFEKQLTSTHSVNDEFDKIITNVKSLDDKKTFPGKKPAVLLQATKQNAYVDEDIFAQKAREIIEKLGPAEPPAGKDKEGKFVTKVRTGDLFLILKVASHYTAYRAINIILKDIEKNIKTAGSVLYSAMGFVADAKTEAKFGNTKLPLWMVYGQGGGAHYLGTKDTFKPLEFDELINNPEAQKVDQPFVVIRIEKSKVTASSYGLGGHNVTEVYLMSGFDEKKHLPKYLFLNFTTSSGSRFTMKPEVEKEITKSWIP